MFMREKATRKVVLALLFVLGTCRASVDDDGNSWGPVFGVYVGFFVGLLVLFTLVDLSGIFDRFVHRLAKTSHDNIAHDLVIHRYHRSRTETMLLASCGLLECTCISALAVMETACCCCCCCCAACCLTWARRMGDDKAVQSCACCASSTDNDLSEEYLAKVQEGLLYLGTVKYNPEEDDAARMGGKFPPGYWSDLTLYLMNDHSILSQVLTIRGLADSRHVKRITFFCVSVLTFLVTTCIFRGYSLSEDDQELISFLFLSPVTLAVRRYIYFLAVCPCLRRVLTQTTTSWLTVAETIGLSLILPIMLLSCVLLILPALLYSVDAYGAQEIADYAYSVIAWSAVLDVLNTWRLFGTGWAHYRLALNLCDYGQRVEREQVGRNVARLERVKVRYSLYEVGAYFTDKVTVLHLPHVVHEYPCCCGFLVLEVCQFDATKQHVTMPTVDPDQDIGIELQDVGQMALAEPVYTV